MQNQPGSCVQGLLPCTPVQTQVLLLWGHAAPRGAHPVQTQFPRGAHPLPGHSPTPGLRGRGWVHLECRYRSTAQTRGVSISPAPTPKIKHKQQKKESCRVSTFPAKIQGGPSPERPTSSPQSLPRRVNWPLFPAPTAPTAGHEPRAVHSSAPNMFLQKSPTASRGSGWAARRTPWPRWDKQPCTGPCEAQRFPTPRRDSWSQAAPPESYEGPRQPLGCAPSRLLFLDNPQGRKPQAGAISVS